MSLQEQEKAMFDLLFNRQLRNAFKKDPASALSGYDLTEQEMEDFTAVRPDALELDAGMRTNLILSQLCKSFPLTFSLVSSYAEGLGILSMLVDSTTMSCDPVDRATFFGHRLRDEILENHGQMAACVEILEAELAMAWSGANLKAQIIEKRGEREASLNIPADWIAHPIRLAAYTSVASIPQPLQMLKEILVPVQEHRLWNHLKSQPTQQEDREKVFDQQDRRLLICRAKTSQLTCVDPEIEYQTAELAEGFIPLFEHINGTMSVQEMISQLEEAGAPESILESIHKNFMQLLTSGMVQLVS